MKIYNAEGMILGRVAAVVAKQALLGEEVHLVNCEKIYLSGKKEQSVAKEMQQWNRGGYPLKSQKFSRLPDKMLRRKIRGMLPWKVSRGKEAFRKIRCHIGIPIGLANQKMEVLSSKFSIKKLPTLKYITLGQVCKRLGGKI